MRRKLLQMLRQRKQHDRGHPHQRQSTVCSTVSSASNVRLLPRPVCARPIREDRLRGAYPDHRPTPPRRLHPPVPRLCHESSAVESCELVTQRSCSACVGVCVTICADYALGVAEGNIQGPGAPASSESTASSSYTRLCHRVRHVKQCCAGDLQICPPWYYQW